MFTTLTNNKMKYRDADVIESVFKISPKYLQTIKTMKYEMK